MKCCCMERRAEILRTWHEMEKKLSKMLGELMETFDEGEKVIVELDIKETWEIPRKNIMKSQVIDRRPKQIKCRNRL